MPVRVYRVCRAIHAALDGAGARKAGGRWNSRGKAVVYMAESVSLAVLENLVHMSRQDYPLGYVMVAVAIPDDVPIESDEALRTAGPRLGPRMFGDRWIDSLASAVLKVRSAVVPAEHNYLLNPAHRDFAKFVAELPEPFQFDGRLFK